VSTDDAYITGHIAPVSARVAGPVVAVLVDDNQDVKTGAVLVRLDPKDYEVALAQARAAVETARGDLGNANATVPLTSETTASGLRQAEAALAAAQHGSRVAEHDLESGGARSRPSRRRWPPPTPRCGRRRRTSSATAWTVSGPPRSTSGSSSPSRIWTTRTPPTTTPGRRSTWSGRSWPRRGPTCSRRRRRPESGGGGGPGRQRVREAQAAAASARSQLRQVTLKESDVEASRGRLAQALANLEQAQLNLAYTTIRAPLDGRVTKKTVEVGQVVQPGQALLAIVDLDTLWVVANYKETELTNVRGASGRRSRWTPIPASSSGRGWTRSGRIGRRLLAAAARERHRQLHQGGAAGAGEARLRGRRELTASAGPRDVRGPHDRAPVRATVIARPGRPHPAPGRRTMRALPAGRRSRIPSLA